MRLSILFFTAILSAQTPAYQLNSQAPRTVDQGAITPLAHLRAADGGRFIVSRTDSPILPLENPFQAVHSGSSIAVSRDAGTSFSVIEVPGIHKVSSLVFGNKSSGLRYVFGDFSSFAVTRDGGVSWQTFQSAAEPKPPSGPLRAGVLVADLRDENFVYLSYKGYEGISRWSQEFGSFQPVPGLPSNATGPYLRPGAIQLFAAAADSLYLNLTPGGPWEVFAKIPGNQSIAEAAFDVAGTRRIYVLTSTGGLLRSNDDGANWQSIDGPNVRNVRVERISANPFRAGHVLFEAAGASFLSTDGGATLQPIALPAAARDLEFVSSPTTTVFASNRRYISQDSGLTWREHSPGRFGRRQCSPLEAALCYSIGDRFENFYIEKLDANGVLQWASYWGDNDPSTPRSAFVDKQGVLWLNTGRKLARIAPEGMVIDVRVAAETVAAITETGNGRLVAILDKSIAELDPNSLAPIETSRATVAALPPLLAGEDRVAFLSGGSAGFYRPGSPGAALIPVEENFSPASLAWARNGDLLVAGNYSLGTAPRRSRVEVRSWSGSSYKLLTRLEGESSETVSAISVDPSGRFWIYGFTSSRRIPLRAPIFNGPRKTATVGFLSLLPEGGGEPIFSTHFRDARLPLAGNSSLDLIGVPEPSLILEDSFSPGLPGFSSLGYTSYAPLRLEPTTIPTLRIGSVEKRFDASAGDWSKGAWIRVRSNDLDGLSPFELPVWSKDRPQVHEGARLTLNGRPITLLGAGPGYLDAAIDNLDSDENGAPALLVLERNGASSQTLRLIVDRFDFELLPRYDNPESALCYNSDGTENSESNPAPAGSQVALFAIGSQGSPQVYLNPERIGEFDDTDWPTYSSDYVEDVPGVLPGIRYIGLTLKGLGRFTGTRKVGLYRYYEDQPSLYIWVKGQ
jgi:photosystem II stability/assembly factor-like uncharacterized protein